MAQLQPNCAVAPTPGVAGAGNATLLATFSIASDLTDWEIFMVRYQMHNYYTCKPENDVTTKVDVKNLPEYLREEDLMKIFSFFGRVTNLVLVRDKTTSTEFFERPRRGKSKCCGYVNFMKLDDAMKAVEALNGVKYDDKEWSVEITHKNTEESTMAVNQYQVTNPRMKSLDVDKPKEFGSSCKHYSVSSLRAGGAPTPNLPVPILQEGEKQHTANTKDDGPATLDPLSGVIYCL